jgi:hypothetical protein
MAELSAAQRGEVKALINDFSVVPARFRRGRPDAISSTSEVPSFRQSLRASNNRPTLRESAPACDAKPT